MRKLKNFLLVILAALTTFFCAFGVACKKQEEYCECEYCKYFHQYIYYYLQENGIPSTIPEDEVYVETLEITGVEHTKGETVHEMTDSQTGEKWYWFDFIESTDEGGYTKDDNSLASNPNRIKLIYLLTPEDADTDTLSYTLDSENAVFIPETEEVVFLKKVTVIITIKESKGSINARDSVRVRSR